MANENRNSKRKDAPTVSYTVGANRAETLVPEGRLDRELLLSELDADVSANSAKMSLASLWRTWNCLHAEWHGDSVPALPLTPDKIKAVAALMKFRGYRSFPNYVSRAKKEHIALGHSWSELLNNVVRDCTRSV